LDLLLSLDSHLSLKQESELQPKFGCWLRSNSRGTDATLTVASASAPLLQSLKDGLEGRNASVKPLLSLSLRYEDTQGPLQMKARNLHPDKIKLIPARGGHKDAVSITDHAELVISALSELTPVRFAEVGEVVESGKSGFGLSITVKFSTNITTPAHGGRTMFWRAEIEMIQDGRTISTKTDSCSFEYHPREPKIGDAPRIQTLVSDGRPGDLMVLYGDRLGSVHKSLQIIVSFPGEQRDELILNRESLDTSSATSKCFTARLPFYAGPGSAMVYAKDTADGVISNKVPLQIRLVNDAPGMPVTSLLASSSRAKRTDFPTLLPDRAMSAQQCFGDMCVGPSQRNGKEARQSRMNHQQRSTHPYDEQSAHPVDLLGQHTFEHPPISPDSEYCAPKIPTSTPNPYDETPRTQLNGLEREFSCSDLTSSDLVSLLDIHDELQPPFTMDNCREDLAFLSGDWGIAAGAAV